MKVVVNKNGEVLNVRQGFLVSGQTVKLEPSLSEQQGLERAFQHAGKVAASFLETHTRTSQGEFSKFINPIDSNFECVCFDLTSGGKHE